jgi:hypothetical protein
MEISWKYMVELLVSSKADELARKLSLIFWVVLVPVPDFRKEI